MDEATFNELRAGRKIRFVDFSVNYDAPEDEMDDLKDANSVSSDLPDRPGWHMPVIDLDHDAVQLVQSSTPGHFHLYLNAFFTTEQQNRLLDLLVDVGLVEAGFRNASEQRGYTSVRLPWVRKETPVAEPF